MNIAVCDDEPFFRKSLISALEDYSRSCSVSFSISQFSSGGELLSSTDNFDLIFLDYYMGQQNGIDTIKELRKRNITSKVIFVSSFPDIVFESMKYDTFRFLIKPIDPEKLTEALNAFIFDPGRSRHIIVKDMDCDKFISVPENDIIYIQADNVYCIVTTFQKSYRYIKTMAKLQEELSPARFFRSNRSFFVNLSYVTSFNNCEITMCNGQKAVLSKLRYKSFKDTFFNFIKTASTV